MDAYHDNTLVHGVERCGQHHSSRHLRLRSRFIGVVASVRILAVVRSQHFGVAELPGDFHAELAQCQNGITVVRNLVIAALAPKYAPRYPLNIAFLCILDSSFRELSQDFDRLLERLPATESSCWIRIVSQVVLAVVEKIVDIVLGILAIVLLGSRGGPDLVTEAQEIGDEATNYWNGVAVIRGQ